MMLKFGNHLLTLKTNLSSLEISPYNGRIKISILVLLKYFESLLQRKKIYEYRWGTEYRNAYTQTTNYPMRLSPNVCNEHFQCLYPTGTNKLNICVFPKIRGEKFSFQSYYLSLHVYSWVSFNQHVDIITFDFQRWI